MRVSQYKIYEKQNCERADTMNVKASGFGEAYDIYFANVTSIYLSQWSKVRLMI